MHLIKKCRGSIISMNRGLCQNVNLQSWWLGMIYWVEENPQAVEVSLKSHLKFDLTVQSQHQPAENSLHLSTEKLILNFNVISVFI